MAKSAAHINPEMLIWARKTIKLSIELAAQKISVKPEHLNAWERGDAQPTVKKLYKIAEVYRRPFALFYFPKPPKHFKPLKDFRKFPARYLVEEKDEYSLERELLLFQQKREIALELFEQLEIEPPKFQLRGNVKDDPKKLADRIIKYLNINHNEIANVNPNYDALNYWKKILESNGILVFQTSGIPLEVMRGTCIVDETLPVIIINSNDTPNGRIFSLFHELVHIVLRENGISNFRYSDRDVFDPVEIQCNQVAAEVLVPSTALNDSLLVRSHDSKNPQWTTAELKKLASIFCVSQEVILRRLLSIGRTSNAFYNQYRKTRDYYEPPARSGGDYYRNVIAKNGLLFLNLALQGYYQDKLTASSLSDFIKIKVSNLAKLEQVLYAKV